MFRAVLKYFLENLRIFVTVFNWIMHVMSNGMGLRIKASIFRLESGSMFDLPIHPTESQKIPGILI